MLGNGADCTDYAEYNGLGTIGCSTNSMQTAPPSCHKSIILRKAPLRSAGSVFQCNAKFRQVFANLVRHCKILVLPR